MTVREIKWRERENERNGRLYAQFVAGKGMPDMTSDKCWYASYWHDGFCYSCDYWRLHGHDAPSGDGVWVDFGETFETIEEVRTALENVVRLNLGGWP